MAEQGAWVSGKNALVVEFSVKVDALDTDELEALVDDGCAELVRGQFYAEEEGRACFGRGHTERGGRGHGGTLRGMARARRA